MKSLILPALMLLLSLQVSAQPQHSTYPDTINKKRLYLVGGVAAAVYLGGAAMMEFVWYRDHERVPFHYYNDLKGYNQIDKAGHAYVSYWESSAAYHALRWAGVDKKKAFLWGGPVGFIAQAPIEIFDGLYEGWGFSWWDMAANAFGAALFTAQQAALDEQLVLMKFSYSPSVYPDYHSYLGETHFERFFLDYNGHTYWFSANLNGITGLERIPSWLNIALGYSANGMIKEFENPLYYQGKPFPHLERYRQYLFSVDIDFSRIETNKKWLGTFLRAVNRLKVPFPALEYNRVDGIVFRPLYF